MPTRIDDYLAVADHDDDRFYTADQVIAALEGHSTPRTSYPVSYRGTMNETVYYTALRTDYTTVITGRTSSGVTQLAPGLYQYDQPVLGSEEFIAIWDEGDPLDYYEELVVVAP